MISVTDQEMVSLTQVVKKRFGIDFTCYEPKSLKRRISRALTVLELESVNTLWIKLLRDSHFIKLFIDELSVNLTAMFRDPILWKSLRFKVTKEYKAVDKIRIWHAGCSTGEEVFSMSIVLKEANLFSKTRLLATDISSGAIESARQGIFHRAKLDEYSNLYKAYNTIARFEKYYTLSESSFHMDQQLLRNVRFEEHNLISNTMGRKFDIIFCRNVMIYFDNATKRRLLRTFYDCLAEGGFLIIGFYDTLFPLIDQDQFRFYDLPAKVLRKVS